MPADLYSTLLPASPAPIVGARLVTFKQPDERVEPDPKEQKRRQREYAARRAARLRARRNGAE